MTWTCPSQWDAHYANGRGWRTVTPDETALLEDHLGAGGGRTALDVACGTGGYAAALDQLGWEASGIDWAPTAIAQARAAYPRLDFRVGDIENPNLELPPGYYGLITFRLAWAFIANKPAALNRIRDLLTPGGALHITTPVADRLPEERRGIGITTADDTQLRSAPWADVTTYSLDDLRCYTLRRT